MLKKGAHVMTDFGLATLTGEKETTLRPQNRKNSCGQLN